ncbi:MAG: pathogenicity island 1 effector protein SopD, partial [Betaproteobacteria bacterium]|nr:pathogenicity island 1 effector protein SopD [Betaproteobacteria bacterium]
MPVNLNTGNTAYSVNNSRIEKFLGAADRDAALRMGGWDRFKDYFRADNNKKAT